MKKLVKICGMTEGENIRAVEALGADFLGFIFYEKSPRCARTIPNYLPVKAARVGVFVDAPFEEILAKAETYGLTHIQLHGHETPDFCQQVKEAGFQIIKAFSISEAADLRATDAYAGACDYFLFDTKTPGYGGSGQAFDWSILRHYTGTTPFLLSGGIGPESTAALAEFAHPALIGYDLNSRFELSPGIKNVEALNRFINSL